MDLILTVRSGILVSILVSILVFTRLFYRLVPHIILRREHFII